MRSRHENRLAQETSPYLLQHAHNPVDWYPWGEEALSKARAEDKPILLSIGYSACHWCHVMERESFENEEIAALMNARFVPIKVDREERPDLDEIYMNAVQMMTGSGGWPLTVFLTPELEPFYGGTYFPPEDRFGRPGFPTVLAEIGRLFEEERERLTEAAAAVTERLRSLSAIPETGELLTPDLIRRATNALESRFDRVHGGFSPAPKFPPSASLSLLLRDHRAHGDPGVLSMVELTLDKMAAGGMYDQLGGGFHRYSTDAHWLVPHFEKMLYDNALLATVYLEAFRVTGRDVYARVARETLDWVLREMQDAEGGFYSSQDADSEGEEGKFYVWSFEEVTAVLGGDAERFCGSYDVTSSGNWEGKNILHLAAGLDAYDEGLQAARAKLLAARESRVRPFLDDKVLTSWNGLMIAAMARGYRALGEERFLESARRAARFLERTLVDGKRLLATYRSGQAKLKAYLDDHAFLLDGYLELFASDFDLHWLERAEALAAALEELFLDEDKGGFFFTGRDHETLIARTKTGYDGAIPSGNAVAATALLRLAEWTGESRWESLGIGTVRAFQAQIERSPSGFASMLAALDFYFSRHHEVAVVGDAASPRVREDLAALWRIYAPNASIALHDPSHSPQRLLPLFDGKTAGADPAVPRFYLCERFRCEEPTDDVSEVISALQS